MEGSFWTAGGVSHVPGHESLGAFGIGTDVTLALARYHGFPSGAYGGGHGDAEIRGGIWGLGTITGVSDQGALIEGGVEVIDGGGYHASWGTFDLRVGAGYGSFTGSRSAHGVVTLGYGVRSDLSRYRWWRHRPRWPESYGEASIARLVFTVRRTSDTSEILIGMELSPTFFLPPVTWWRIAGGPPQ
ncbi:MAG: hypothetical protein ACXVEF_36030 [Polyangiales bacterium]